MISSENYFFVAVLVLPIVFDFFVGVVLVGRWFALCHPAEVLVYCCLEGLPSFLSVFLTFEKLGLDPGDLGFFPMLPKP
jgi:hypothetical protein